MHRIDGAGHVGNMFVAEDPATNRPPSEVTEGWLNAVQEELVNIATMNGEVLLAPGVDTRTQAREAIKTYAMGRMLSVTVHPNSAVGLLSTQAKNITSINVPAGIWYISATGVISGNGTTQTQYESVSLSLISGFQNITPGLCAQIAATQVFTGLIEHHYAIMGGRFEFLVPTTVFLVANVQFSVNTAAALGTIFVKGFVS